MHKQVKVFFDFLCPYCYESIMDLIDLIPDFPEITIDWEPCEAHPRPEECSQYSDLASEAFLYIKGHNGNCLPFLKSVYKAYYVDHKRIDDKELLLELAKGSEIDVNRLKASLTRRDYKQDVMDLNNDIWNIHGAEAVPAYYCRNKKLVSKENLLISKEELRTYLASL